MAYVKQKDPLPDHFIKQTPDHQTGFTQRIVTKFRYLKFTNFIKRQWRNIEDIIFLTCSKRSVIWGETRTIL